MTDSREALGNPRGPFIAHSRTAQEDEAAGMSQPISKRNGVSSVPRWRAAAIAVSMFWLISFFTRIALVADPGLRSSAPPAEFVRAFAAGAFLDLLASLWLAVPLVLLLAVLPRRWLARRVVRAALALGLAAAFGVALFVAAVEFFFFQEFGGRFNFVAVDYLLFPTEVVGNIWQSYHTGLVLAGIGLMSGVAFLILRRLLHPSERGKVPQGNRFAFPAVYAAVLAVLTFALPRDLARVSSDRVVNELAGNGYRSFWLALRGQDAPYEGLYRSNSAEADFGRLHRLLAERATDLSSFAANSTLRHIRALREPRRSNVVLVLEESLGAEFVGALHPGKESLTPAFDALIPQGTLLTRAYSTGNRTIRALEATTASLPPLPGVSIVRREKSRDLFTLPELLRARGYGTLFVYGGRAVFDGMGRYMKANGVQRVVEEADFAKGTFRTAWGVSDEAIFDRALEEMDSIHATAAPFCTIILTVTNHRPFLYPRGRIAADPAEQRRVNAVRYADFALGRFVATASRHAFFDDTLFVLMGDHGPRVYGSAEIPMPSYEIPILFYGPRLVTPGVRVPTIASSMDVPPTVLGLLGVEYDSKFFGRDVLQLDPSGGRALLTHNNEIGLLEGNDLATLGLHRAATVYRYDRENETLDPVRASGAGSSAGVEDAIAYFDGADKLYREGGYEFSTAGTTPMPDAAVLKKLASSKMKRASRAVRGDPDAARRRGRIERGNASKLAAGQPAAPRPHRLACPRGGSEFPEAMRIRHRRKPRRPARTGEEARA
jgi:phosphoglycerol transferase MdoB-like AlkP superfamily enzyme